MRAQMHRWVTLCSLARPAGFSGIRVEVRAHAEAHPGPLPGGRITWRCCVAAFKWESCRDTHVSKCPKEAAPHGAAEPRTCWCRKVEWKGRARAEAHTGLPKGGRITWHITAALGDMCVHNAWLLSLAACQKGILDGALGSKPPVRCLVKRH